MNFKVMNRRQAIKYSYETHDETSIIISVSSFWDDCPKFSFGSKNILGGENKDNHINAILYLKFDDISQVGNRYIVDGGYEINPIMVDSYVAISDQDAADIVNFVTRWKDKVDTIIVHCDAGISRSSGCCAAIMKAITGSDNAIFDNLMYRPNMTVYHKCLEQFAKAGYQGVYGR